MQNNPIINPLLRLKTDPKPTSITGGGKTHKQIKDSLAEQRKILSEQLVSIADKIDFQPTFANKTLLIAKMQPDSLAPTLTPNDLFSVENNSAIVAPAYQGYLVEISSSNIKRLAQKIESTNKTQEKVDISRLQSIGLFDSLEVLRGKKSVDIWDKKRDKAFQAYNIWLMPFKNPASRLELANTFAKLLEDQNIRFGDPDFSSHKSEIIQENLLHKYLEKGFSSLSIEIRNIRSLDRIASSGTVYRIEPCLPIKTTTAPGTGQEPTPASISLQSPTVVVIDGGVSAQSYLPYELIKVPQLVPTAHADLAHGNKVVSLVCHAHAWNNNRAIPKLDCTFISAQAICKKSATKYPNNTQLIDYLEKVAKKTHKSSRVWNLSFNQIIENTTDSEVSYLGHKISEISRKYGILPVISIGNTQHNYANKSLCPPADCESALTVSARDIGSSKDELGNASAYSLHGPGPAGMIKPDLSWFGTLRMIGGAVDKGTSFCTPLVSSLAAHAFQEIKGSTPDLIRALLINRADLSEHCHKLGWGTPSVDGTLPWHCQDDTVTLAWTAQLPTGSRHYWHDIPIPKELIEHGKFKGTVALTAILKPIVSELGGNNYFSSRLETSFQADRNGKTVSLAGSMKESIAREQKARQELAKWSPVRHHVKTHKNGTQISGDKAKVYARVFTRDGYQFENDTSVIQHEVSFVLTFKSNDINKKIYNAMVQRLGSHVESALIDQSINIGHKMNR